VTHALDRRTRCNADLRSIDAASFFEGEFAELAGRHGSLVADAFERLDAPPLGIVVDGRGWTVTVTDGRLLVEERLIDGAPTITLTAEQFSDWAQDHRSLNAFHVGMELPLRNAGELEVSLWDCLWRCLLDGWPVVGDLAFVDRSGAPLDLTRVFTPADDEADIAHQLREAGFLHLRGWIDDADIQRVSQEIDDARAAYAEGDGRSWWAELEDGERVVVRMQRFVEHSPTSREILASDRWVQLIDALAGDDDLHQGRPGDAVTEALVKPVGVAAGISDLTFHRDCHFGRHAYGCSGVDVGITVTPSGPANGRLGVVAGSHRLAIPVEIAKTKPYLPVIGVATEAGDCTVHLSCTLHESTAPRTATRKVMYTPYKLPPLADDVDAPTRPGPDLRERVHAMYLPPTTGDRG
jgi:hypothetical protein